MPLRRKVARAAARPQTTVSVESLTVAGTTVSGTCTDKAGNTSASTEAVVKLDLTDPTIDADAGDYVSGSWTNQTVTVSFNCFDALSGLLGTCPADVVVSSNTAAAGQNVSGTVSDKAGNTATSNTINVKVDKTAPTISGSRLPRRERRRVEQHGRRSSRSPAAMRSRALPRAARRR